MLANPNAETDGTTIPPPLPAAPVAESVEKRGQPAQARRLRVEEIEPRIAPNAIWGD